MKKIAVVGAAAALLLTGCGGGEPTAPAAARTVTVLAAASLTDVFGELERRFEADNPGVDVVASFAGSSNLADQIVNGAPADVFASAAPAQMKKVVDAGLGAGEPAVFTTNRLQIAVTPGNPKGIASFADLTKPSIITVVCQAQVPCGSATEKVEMATGITLTPASEETEVTSVLSKVTSGNADAGVVYVTEVLGADGKVDGVNFPEADKAINDYPIVALKNSKQPELAAKFVDLVRGPDGQKVLEAAGFGTS